MADEASPPFRPSITPPSGLPPRPRVPAPTRPTDLGNANTVAMTEDGLPKRVRVRQMNIVQPLFEMPDTEVIEVDAPVTARTPEKMRTMLASFQDGTMLGRRNARTQTDSGDVPGPASTEHRSTEVATVNRGATRQDNGWLEDTGYDGSETSGTDEERHRDEQ